MRNQPRYHPMRNTRYALKGIYDICRHETSFQIELLMTLILLPVIIGIDTPLSQKLVLFLTLMGVLIAETVNSAIERIVDLITIQHHPMAGRTKDIGSAIVLLSIATLVLAWSMILFDLLTDRPRL